MTFSNSCPDTMDKWDEEKLRTVVLSKTGNPRTTTDASTLASSSKHTSLTQRQTDCLQVLHPSYRIREVRLFSPVSDLTLILCCRYGWFWECPNGESCHYRHALPPGFVLKSQKKAIEDAEKANAITLEEFLEVEVQPTRIYSGICIAHSTMVPASQAGYQPHTGHP